MARIAIKLTPGAASDRIDGWVRVRARPVEGGANAALILLLAKSLGVARSAVSLARGGQSRLKMIEVEGLDDAELRDRLTGM